MDTEAIVLNCSDHGESDIIVSLFCREAGRLTAIAKGAKKSQRRFVNKLELFSFLRVSCNRKTDRNLAFLEEADLFASFINIRRDLELYALASVMREFLLLGMSEGEPDERVFRLILWALHHLDRKRQPKTILVLFLIRYFDYLGYRPDLETCSTCRTPVIPSKGYTFQPTGGRIVCSSCNTGKNRGRNLSHGTIKALRAAQDSHLDRLHRLQISGSILEEALFLLHNYGKTLFQRDIVSWKTMQRYIGG
jgi:DNA repair protein RecO (recombination protein O)